jgi:hypothetical protein
MKTIVRVAAFAIVLVGPLAARAEVIDLTYVGTPTYNGSSYGMTDAEGSGILVIPDGATSVTYDDIISFSFTLTLNGLHGDNNPISDTDTFSTANLDPANSGYPSPGFSATLDGSGTLLSMSLVTDTGPDGFWFPNQALDFTLDGDSSTGNFDVGTMSTGTFTALPTPEPASLTLLGSGLVAALGLRRRKR